MDASLRGIVGSAPASTAPGDARVGGGHEPVPIRGPSAVSAKHPVRGRSRDPTVLTRRLCRCVPTGRRRRSDHRLVWRRRCSSTRGRSRARRGDRTRTPLGAIGAPRRRWGSRTWRTAGTPRRSGRRPDPRPGVVTRIPSRAGSDRTRWTSRLRVGPQVVRLDRRRRRPRPRAMRRDPVRSHVGSSALCPWASTLGVAPA